MDAQYSATADAGGRAVVKIRPDRMVVWTVTQVSVEMVAAPVGAACDLRKNGSLITPLVPTGDAAGGDPPVTITQADTLTVTWTSCDPGNIGTVFVIYDEGDGR